jgi:hypothetical protein
LARPEPSFTCTRCRLIVNASPYGTAHRNHCPRCLWSRHVDNAPGDRMAGCHGGMEPIAVAVRRDEWAIIHRCGTCGTLKQNRIAGDDDAAHLLALAARPLANPPFPLDRF